MENEEDDFLLEEVGDAVVPDFVEEEENDMENRGGGAQTGADGDEEMYTGGRQRQEQAAQFYGERHAHDLDWRKQQMVKHTSLKTLAFLSITKNLEYFRNHPELFHKFPMDLAKELFNFTLDCMVPPVMLSPVNLPILVNPTTEVLHFSPGVFPSYCQDYVEDPYENEDSVSEERLSELNKDVWALQRASSIISLTLSTCWNTLKCLCITLQIGNNRNKLLAKRDLRGLVSSFPLLEELCIYDGYGDITDMLLKRIAHYCPQLRYLNAVDLHLGVKPAGLRILGKLCSKLEKLYLNFDHIERTGKAQGRHVAYLLSCLPNLKVLETGYGLGIVKSGVKNYAKLNPMAETPLSLTGSVNLEYTTDMTLVQKILGLFPSMQVSLNADCLEVERLYFFKRLFEQYPNFRLNLCLRYFKHEGVAGEVILQRALKICGSLVTQLSVYADPRLTVDLSMIGALCPQLKKLTMEVLEDPQFEVESPYLISNKHFNCLEVIYIENSTIQCDQKGKPIKPEKMALDDFVYKDVTIPDKILLQAPL